MPRLQREIPSFTKRIMPSDILHPRKGYAAFFDSGIQQTNANAFSG